MRPALPLSRRTLRASAAFAALLVAAPAFATDAAPAAQGDETATTEPADSIVVTATRREELAKDVPVAVSAIGGDKLDVLNSSGLDIRFLSSRTPSLQVESSFGRTFPRFYIRGLGNTDFDPNAAQPVSVVYDNVALESPMLKSFPVFDLQSVEVLRGPQGTLFGRNTPAGVIKLSSARPSDTWEGKFSASLATYNSLNVEAAVGGPIADGLSFRLSGLVQRRDNWITNDSSTGVAPDKVEGYDDRAARLQVAYESGPLNLLLNAHGRELDGTPRIFRAGLFQQGSNEFSPGFDPEHVALDGYVDQTLRQWGGNAQLDYHFDGLGTLFLIAAHEAGKVRSTGDIDGGNTYGFPALGLNKALFPVNTGGLTEPRETSGEIRFAFDPIGRFRGQTGFYYFHQKLGYHEYSYPLGGGASTQDIVHANLNENFGVFASGEYEASDALTLRAGVRYSHDRKVDRVSGYAPTVTAGLTLPVETRLSGEDVTWDLSATYKLNDDVNFYARIATGYQGPAIQDRVVFGSRPTTAGKQTTLSAEGGIKGAVPGSGINFALTGYWFRTDDLQLTAVGGATNSARLLSADHVNAYGVEAEFSARPIPHLDLSASGSYNFTEIKDPALVVAVCGAMCTVTDPTTTVGGTRVARVDGNRLPQAPRLVLNTTLRYGVPLANGGEIFGFTDWAYRSEINYFIYEAKEFRGRALLEGGVKLGYRSPAGLEVAAFARNVTNQIRSISAIDFNNLTGMINEPRTIGGEVRFSF